MRFAHIQSFSDLQFESKTANASPPDVCNAIACLLAYVPTQNTLQCHDKWSGSINYLRDHVLEFYVVVISIVFFISHVALISTRITFLSGSNRIANLVVVCNLVLGL
jgi:hypothetical protein